MKDKLWAGNLSPFPTPESPAAMSEYVANSSLSIIICWMKEQMNEWNVSDQALWSSYNRLLSQKILLER